MGIKEVLKALQEGKWVRRKVWHPDYAIRSCNGGSALISSINLMYHFGTTHAPLKGDDLNQNNINEREYGKSNPTWRKCGLDQDMLCNDWEIADTELCLKIVERSEIEHQEFLKKAHEESCRFWGDGKGRDYHITELPDGRWC